MGLFDKWIPKEIRKPISSAIDFVDEDILDPAGEFLEEEILDPAGEWLGEEVAQPIRKELSSWMPNELQAFAGTLGGIGGGKLGYLIAGMMTGNPYLIALGAGIGAAAGDIAADYSTTDENVEWDPNYVSAALSGTTAGLGAFKGADAVKGTEFLEGDTLSKSNLKELRDTAAKTAELADASVGTAAQGATAMQAAEAQQNLENVMNMIDAGTLNMTTGTAGNLTAKE